MSLAQPVTRIYTAKYLRLEPPANDAMRPPNVVISPPELDAWSTARARVVRFDIDAALEKMRIGTPADYEPEFLAPSSEARSLAKDIAAVLVLSVSAGTIPIPEFMASGDGAVHLRWKSGRGELLIAAPHKGGRIGQFFARAGGLSLKGSLDADGRNGHLAQWLLENV